MIIFLIISILVFVIFYGAVKPSKRKATIDSILLDLEDLLVTQTDGKKPIEENIRFFRATKHVVTFLLWQLFHAPRVNKDDLLELADLPIQRWEKQLYKDLQWVERKRFPGLLRPLTTYLANKDAKIMLDIGCGSMEVERQVISLLNRDKSHKKRIFIGVDNSPTALQMIEENFKNKRDLVSIHSIRSLDRKDIAEHLDGELLKHRILFLHDSANNIVNEKHKYIDVAFSCKFKHHLSEDRKKQFDISITNLAREAIEFDDYRTASSWIPLAITAWRRPALLNGALLSRLRQPSKSELGQDERSHMIKLYNPPGSYIKFFKADPAASV